MDRNKLTLRTSPLVLVGVLLSFSNLNLLAEEAGKSHSHGGTSHTHGVVSQAQTLQIDITNQIFSNRNPDCAGFDETYSSQVLDVNYSRSFEGMTQISAATDTCLIESNNIPNHDFNDAERPFANQVAEVAKSFTIERLPDTFADEPTYVSQALINGIMLNGVVIDILSAGCWDEARGDNVAIGCSDDAEWLIDPVGSGFFDEDTHNAHSQGDGTYHYHGNPNAMFDDNPGPNGSPVIGFAADGYPIYGSYFLDPESGEVRKATSGYRLKRGLRPSGPGGRYDGFYIQEWRWTRAGDLDECNGMTLDGQYGYYVTDSYPWLMKCFNGEPNNSFYKRAP